MIGHNDPIARRRPNLRAQLAVVALAVTAVVVASFALSGDGSGDGPGDGVGTAPTDGATGPTSTLAAATTTGSRGFPAALDESVCRSLLPLPEAEALVGRPLSHDVIEPRAGQCAWPAEEGTPLGAPLFLVVKRQEGPDLAEQLREVFTPDRFRLEPSPVAEQAYVVVGTDPAFVEGLEAYTDELHVVLGNGGDPDAWSGDPEEIRARLEAAMTAVLDRVPSTLG